MAKKKRPKTKPTKEELEEGWIRCPECNGKIKEDNLRKHLQKVHGLTKAQASRVVEDSGPGVKKSSKASGITIIMVVMVVVIIVIVSVFVLNMSQDEPKPKFRIDRISHDFGNIQSEKVTTTFTITNDGDDDLVIRNFKTSCVCTETYLSIDGKKGPTFTTEGDPDYKGRITPGGKGTLSVTYDPNIFSDQGPVARQVVFITNDDDRSDVTITVQANVQ